MEKVIEFVKRFWIPLVIVLLVLVLIIVGAKGRADSQDNAAQTAISEEEARAKAREALAGSNATQGAGTDKMLIQMQQALKNQFGEPPEGFVWDRTGKPLSLGYPNMSSEDVVFGYLRALSTLDMGMAQRLSRGSQVVGTYDSYFDPARANQSADEIFKRDKYKTALLSLEIDGIESSAVSAESKRSYTVNAKIVDFENITFWEKDKDKIFNDLYESEVVRGDYSSVDTYINNYVTDFYTSEDAPKRSATFTLTVEKYADINSGWLISLDTDLKNSLTNVVGTTNRNKSVNTYIKEEYNTYKLERQRQEMQDARNSK